MRKLVFVFWLAPAVAAWSDEPPQAREPSAYRVEQAPAPMAAGIQAADGAITALQRRLSARLLEELQKGGPSRAIAVCRDEAQALTAETERAQGIRVGRTSHRLRNPGNAAPAWAERFVTAAKGQKASAVEAAVVDLGDRVGLLRPIPTAAMCTQCHGLAERLSPDVKVFLATAYPDDRAVGFEEGDLRGFIWAEAPLQRAATPQAQPQQDTGAPATGEQFSDEELDALVGYLASLEPRR